MNEAQTAVNNGVNVEALLGARELAIPISGLPISSGFMPVPYSIAWDAPWDLGSVIRELVLLSFSVIGALS